MIEHVDDPAAFLRNAAALAAPGATLLLSTQSGPVHETERSVGHVRHFCRSTMETLLKQSGWEPVRVWNAGFPFHDLSKWWANRNPYASIQRFGNCRYGPFERAICAALRLAFLFNTHSRGAQLFVVARRKHAAPSPSTESSDGVDDQPTADGFATSWNNVGPGSVYTPEQFWDWLAPLGPEDVAGSDVLELASVTVPSSTTLPWLGRDDSPGSSWGIPSYRREGTWRTFQNTF